MKRPQAFHNSAPLPLFDSDGASRGQRPDLEPRPEMVCFRGQTLAMVRHFFELSCQAGRLPSLLGREFFRAKVSHHAVPSFEEQIVFLRDMQLCLGRLREEDAQMITLAGFYDLSSDEVAELLRCSRWWVYDHFGRALDALSEIFLRAELLDENHPDRRQRQTSRQKFPGEIDHRRKRPRASTEANAREIAG